MTQTNYFSMFRLRLTLLCFTLGIAALLLKDFFGISIFALIMKSIALRSRKKKKPRNVFEQLWYEKNQTTSRSIINSNKTFNNNKNVCENLLLLPHLKMTDISFQGE